MTPDFFVVDVDGVGSFEFRRRTMRDELRIEAEYSRLTEGVVTPSRALDVLSRTIATLKVLTVKTPEGWSVDALDPLDDDDYKRLLSVGEAHSEKELSFRKGRGPASPASGQGNGEQPGVLVP